MAEEEAAASDFLATKRVAVVTGGNKGIGLEICKQLASKGVKVVLTARDEKRGVEAIEELNNIEQGGSALFHQLDVTDPISIASLADFIRTQFGKLDILINNAGVLGVTVNYDKFARAVESLGDWPFEEQIWKEIITSQTYEMAEECLNTNYFGMKRMVEAFVPLLQLSDSPRIVNVSSLLGALMFSKNEWAKGVLSDVDSLTEERIELVLKEYLKDFKEEKLQAKGWPTHAGVTTYCASKEAMNAYTRLLAKKYPGFRVNGVTPGFVKTDITGNVGKLTAAEGAENIVRVALQPIGGPTGLFFNCREVSDF